MDIPCALFICALSRDIRGYLQIRPLFKTKGYQDEDEQQGKQSSLPILLLFEGWNYHLDGGN